MASILTVQESYASDKQTIEAGTPSRTLMERAARGALSVLKQELDCTCVLFVCGSGNNGGDGLAMARFFAEQGGHAKVCYVGAWQNGTPNTQTMSAEAATQLALLPDTIPVQEALDTKGVTAIVDAIFGIGLSRPVEGKLQEVITAINQSAVPVLALDIPSGLSADRGTVFGVAVRAAHTVAISALKFGHLLYPGAALCGKLHLQDIGISAPPNCARLLEKKDLDALPARSPRGHKGSFGRVLIIGGRVGMSGAAYFAAKAAYRTGAGLVEILAPEENRIIYQTQLPEALLTLYDPSAPDKRVLRAAIERADAIAIGMGLGTGTLTQTLLSLTLMRAKVPLLLDADALNELSSSPELYTDLLACKVPVVITPHLGEAARLLGVPLPLISSDLPGSAERLARKADAVCVLKDARTLICDGIHTAVNAYGNNGMATGGSGDVLAGVIAALLATTSSARLAAELGVLVHALAGDAAKERVGLHGMMASDLLDALPLVLP